MADRTYYLVSDKSPVRQVIEAAKKRHRDFFNACQEFATEFGSKQWYSTQSFEVHILGLVFDGDPPEGWRANRTKSYATPDGKTKAGKEIKKRMAALPSGLSSNWLSHELNEKSPNKPRGYTHWAGNSISWSTFEKIGKAYILSVPSACKASPPGCRELKMSEYWKIRESAEGRKKA